MGLFHKLTFIDALEILDCSSLSEQQKKKVIKAESHFTEDEKTACNMLLCLHKDDGMALALLIINLINRENLPGEINAALYTHIAFRKFSEAHEKDPSKPDYIAYLALAYEHGSFCCEKDHSKAVEMAEPLRSSEATGALVKQALKDIFPEGADSAASDNKSADTPESEKANAAAIADTESTSPVVPSAAKGSSDKSAQQAEFKRLEIDGGDVFEGYFLNGKKNGHGKYIWANGDVFDGNWVDGKRNGKGKVTWSNGASFDGEWKDNQMSEGKRTYPNGEKYEGQWHDGKMHGRGTYTWADGTSYEGEWKDNQKSGQGRYTFASGSYYEGTLENDSFEGNGKRVYAGGDVYEGQWHDSKKHGRGTYTWADGTYYEGEFADGNFNGFGKKVYSSGDVYEGQWKDDKRTGKGRITWSNGDTYEGDWRDGERCGRGKLIQYGKGRATGEPYMKYSYDGEWLDSKEHGHGICVEGDSGWEKMDKVFEGEWVNGKRQGRFVWHFLHRDGETGKSYIDFYEDGKLVETCIPYDERIKTVDDAKKFREAEKRARISAVKTDFRLAKQLDMNIVASVGYYNGDYMNGERNGYGECAYDNGDKYIGTWKDGAANGVGRYAFARGGFYFGQFSNGRVDGYGVYFDGNDYHIGVFENGECVTERDLVFEIGSEGKWLPLVFESDESIQIYGDLKKPSDSIMKYSEGVEYSSSARMWVASFNENLMVMGKVLQKGGPVNDQNGVFIYTDHADGLVATGEIRNSMLNGRVTIRYITGETVEADCADNKPIETYHRWDKFGREDW